MFRHILTNVFQSTFPDRKGRFARILLRLPSLRSIGLEAEIETFIDSSELENIPDSDIQEILNNHESTPDQNDLSENPETPTSSIFFNSFSKPTSFNF